MNAIEIVQRLIESAITISASDIHLEPSIHDLKVRFRIDGVLYYQESIHLEIASQVISRIKVLGYMDISEYRLPQDGKYSGKFLDKNIDIRMSTFPTLYGEKVVLRLLDRSSNNLSLDKLGFSKNIINNLKNISHQQTGLFLVTGPTGSGKTTTLHSMLSYSQNSEKNIVTLEDPIEYHIDNICQTQIHSDIGLTFANGLRSILRQDPDVIMVGEIRDKETAQVAIQAALTGHLVLSTLHTTDAISSLIRLLDMGIEPFLINGALTGILNQRLLRKPCSCYPSGCPNCHNLGYSGRLVIGEMFTMNPEMRQLISNAADYDSLYNQAIKDGMISLKEQINDNINAGILKHEFNLYNK